MHKLRILVLLIAVAGIGAAPFFDAIYDAIAGNGRRSYGYNNNYGYNGYANEYEGYRSQKPKQGRSFKQLCRVHYPDSFGAPGSAGVVCPY